MASDKPPASQCEPVRGGTIAQRRSVGNLCWERGEAVLKGLDEPERPWKCGTDFPPSRVIFEEISQE